MTIQRWRDMMVNATAYGLGRPCGCGDFCGDVKDCDAALRLFISELLLRERQHALSDAADAVIRYKRGIAVAFMRDAAGAIATILRRMARESR